MENTRIIVTFDGFDYRVPAPDGTEDSAYYTNNLHDAVATAREMYNDYSLEVAFKNVDVHPDVRMTRLSSQLSADKTTMRGQEQIAAMEHGTLNHAERDMTATEKVRSRMEDTHSDLWGRQLSDHSKSVY